MNGTPESPPGRWAAFEAQVLSKVENPEQCRQVIAQRQAQVDDDSNESDLVSAHLRQQLRAARQDPDSCSVFFLTAEIAKWLQEAIGTKLALNKVTPYLRVLGIPELSYTKKTGVPGWVWRGQKASPAQTAKPFSTLRLDPRD